MSIKPTACRKDILLGPVAFLEVRQFLVHIFSVVWQRRTVEVFNELVQVTPRSQAIILCILL